MKKKQGISGTDLDKRTKAYRDRLAADGIFGLDPDVEAFASFMYDAGYHGTPDQSYWVPTKEIAGVVRSQFPKAPILTPAQLGQAIRAAEPDAKRVQRRPKPGARSVWGWAGIKGPCGCRTHVVED